MRGAVLVGATLACGGCGSLLEIDLPVSSGYAPASAHAASVGVTGSKLRSYFESY